MIVQAEAADELMDSDPHRAHRALGHVQDTGRAALADIRGLLGALRGQGDGPGLRPNQPPGSMRSHPRGRHADLGAPCPAAACRGTSAEVPTRRTSGLPHRPGGAHQHASTCRSCTDRGFGGDLRAGCACVSTTRGRRLRAVAGDRVCTRSRRDMACAACANGSREKADRWRLPPTQQAVSRCSPSSPSGDAR